MATSYIEGFHLSPQQRRVWSVQDAGQAFCCQCVVSIEGALDKGRLRAAIRSVIDKHEILRTTFHCMSGLKYPIQFIADEQQLDLSQHSLNDLGEGQLADGISILLKEMRHASEEFGHGSPLRVSLLTRAPRRHVLLISMPALCGDKKTLQNLVGEISRSYAACRNGEAVTADLLQYADAAEALNRLLDAEETAVGRDYWREKNLAALCALRLPFRRQHSAPTFFEPHVLSFSLSPVRVRQLGELAARYQTTTAAVLLSCLHALLWRLTGQTEITVGTAFDGRTYDELKGALGLFAKYVPIQCRWEEDSPFSSILTRIEESMREGAERQEYFSWEHWQGAQATETPFFPVCFEFEEPAARYIVDETCFFLSRQEVCFDLYKVKLTCVAGDGEIEIRLHYDPRAAQEEQLKRLAGQFENLLGSVLDDPEKAVGELDILSDSERRQLLREWNSTEADFTSGSCLHQLFEAQAERTPDLLAVVCNGEQLTYRELNRRANQLARQLQRLGVGPEGLVGLYLERSLGVIVGMLGVLKAGGAYAPLDLENPPARLNQQLESLKPRVLLTQEHLLAAVPNYRGTVLCLDRDCSRLEAEEAASLAPATEPENLAYVIFTSGSTGDPKGVAITHRSLVNYTLSISAKLKLWNAAADRQLKFASVSTFSADLGNTAIFPALVTGGCLHVLGHEVVTDAEKFRAYVRQAEIDVLKIVPSHLNALMSARAGGDVLPRRYLLLGGERLSVELLHRLEASGNGCVLINHYGPTETTVGSLTFTCRQSIAFRDETPTVPIGRPIANTEVYVLDSRLEPVPVGAPGELYIGGRGVARGYLRLPELTAARMIPHPFSTVGGARLYRTGDLVRYLLDGNIEFLGRVDSQVKVRGFRVELGEVESVLRRHTSVREVAVLTREDAPGEVRVVAYVVPHGEHFHVAAELRTFAKEELPGYMVPSAFVMLKNLPRTPNGKLDKRALPAPDQTRAAPAEDSSTPLTETEKALVEIWSQVLRVEHVGPHDNFFELGGDSIVSIQIAARAHTANLHLTPLQIFQYPTIAELASLADAPGATNSDHVEASDLVPLTPIQAMFFERELPDASHWNLSALLTLKSPIELAVLTQAVQILIKRHDALRLRFRRVGASWQQTLAEPDGAVSCSRIDLSLLSTAEQSRALEAEATELQKSLSLTEGPLLRVASFDLGPERASRLLIVIHHLAVDIFSWRILLEDLHAACQQLGRGQEVELAAATTSFTDWATGLARYARSAGLRGESSYWLSEARRDVQSLPVDFPDGRNTVASARVVSVSVPVEETRELLSVLKDYRVQMNEALLTAVTLAFTRRQQVGSLLIDLEGHGRESLFPEAELARTVGWFTSIYPVLLTVDAHDQPGEALQAIKQQLREVPNGGIGYGLLRYLSGDEEITARLRALPAPVISFNYLGQTGRLLPKSAQFALAAGSAGPNQNLLGLRPHLLEISASVTDGQLRMDWTYSENCHRQDTVKCFAEDCTQGLLSLIKKVPTVVR
jgi:amino acid adenylation domain-containing protein/non-ribosomal peptide synthase protein (TIGR01720 family)